MAILVLVVLFFWWPTKNLPYWWDSAGFIIHGARYYLENNFSSLLLPSDSSITAFAHPPLFVLGLALAWKILGESILVAHIYYLFFVLLAAIFAYFLAKELMGVDSLFSSLAGLGAVLLLFFTPVFFAQIGIIYVEIPAAAFALITVFLFLRKKRFWYFLCGTLTLFLKETAVVVIMAVLASLTIGFLIEFWQKKKLKIRIVLKELFFYASPLLPLALWFILHKILTGWMFVMPYYQQGLIERAFSLAKFAGPLRFFFWDQGRFLVSLFILGCLVFCVFKKDQRGVFQKKEFFLLIFIIGFSIFTFGVLDFLHRYLVFSLSFFYLLFIFCLNQAFKNRPAAEKITILGALVLISLTVFSLNWDKRRAFMAWNFPPIEENLEYRDLIKVGGQAAGFLERYYPEAEIWTSFPLNYMLGEPFQGYVSKPLKVHGCPDYQPGQSVDLVVFHVFSPTSQDCLKLVYDLNLRLLTPFEVNGKWVQIFKNQEQ